jgi:hypothetical protein
MQDAIAREAAERAAGGAREAVNDTVSLFTQSKLALNGLLLAIVGFFGIFGALTLQLQSAIFSVYVFLFGVALIFFAAGWRGETLKAYFGFVYRPGGQLVFLLIAGNLAWSTGILGLLVAIYTNITAIGHWYTIREHIPHSVALPIPSWLPRQPSAGQSRQGNATGMVDLQDDELL